MKGSKLTIQKTDNETVLATWIHAQKMGEKWSVEDRTEHITLTSTNKKARDRFHTLIDYYFFGEKHPDHSDSFD